ncbi:putative reverse transcriptase domain-containing protein [Tanacetum coccineum]
MCYIEAEEAENEDDNENGNGGGRRNERGGRRNDGNDNGGRNGNNRNNNNGNGDQRDNMGGAKMVARECTYKKFLNWQSFNFKVTEEAVGLARWFKKMESVFHISNYPPKYQVKYASGTLQNNALTWNEIQKVESELWNLTVKGNDLTAYTQRFQELILLCPKMVPEEEDRVKRYIWGLPDNIQGNVTTSVPKRLQDVVRMASGLMDQKPESSRDECGRQGHFCSDCPKLKNQNQGNQATTAEARGRVFALGRGEVNKDSNVVTGTFLLNNCYASMLFDSGADRSFVSTTFSSLMDVVPTVLDDS